MKGIPLFPILVDHVKETVLMIMFVCGSMLAGLDMSVGGAFRRRLLRSIVFVQNGFSIFFHTDEVMGPSNGVL